MNVKKFFVKLIIFVLPFICFFSLFLVKEPFDYFGIHNDMRGFSEPNPIPRIRYFINNKNKASLVLGDSRSAYLSLETIESLTGLEVANLSFGGASLRESIDLFWLAAEKRELKKVFFQLSFYTFNENYGDNRVKQASYLAEDFVGYIKNSDIQKMTWIKEKPAEASNESQPVDHEKELRQYAEVIKGVCDGYVFNEAYIEELIEIANYCKSNNIELLFCAPPMHTTIWDMVVYPLELEPHMDRYKSILSYHATVYDMEYNMTLSDKTEDFVDGFHFKDELLTEYLNMTFANKGEHYRVWKNGEVVS